MIRVSGSAQRSFLFPASRTLAYAYYGDVGRLLNYLPHIGLVRAYGPDRFRLLYSSTELGAYRIEIFADVQAILDDGWVLHVRPLNGVEPVKPEAGLHSARTQGYFSSRSLFLESEGETQVEYDLQLRAKLPKPLGLRFMPGRVVNRIAKSITNVRIRDIAEGFIELSIAAFPHWLEEIQNSRHPPPWGTATSLPRPNPETLEKISRAH